MKTTNNIILLGWIFIDLFTIAIALVLSQILFQFVADFFGIALLSEDARILLQRYSFWIVIPLAGILFLFGWLKQWHRRDCRLIPQELILGVVIYAVMVQFYLYVTKLPLRYFFICFIILTMFTVITVHFLVHYRLWLGDEKSEKFIPLIFRKLDQRFRKLARQRPVILLLGGSGVAMVISLILIFSKCPRGGDILSNWAYILFATGVITDLLREKRRDIKDVG